MKTLSVIVSIVACVTFNLLADHTLEEWRQLLDNFDGIHYPQKEEIKEYYDYPCENKDCDDYEKVILLDLFYCVDNGMPLHALKDFVFEKFRMKKIRGSNLHNEWWNALGRILTEYYEITKEMVQLCVDAAQERYDDVTNHKKTKQAILDAALEEDAEQYLCDFYSKRKK